MIKLSKTVKPVVLPRKVRLALGQVLAEKGRAVIVNGGAKRFKVYTIAGYFSAKHNGSKNARKHKPWIKAAAHRAARAEANK